MLGTVERSHASIAFDPNHNVFKLGVDVATCCDQFVGMAPIHAHEMNGAILAVLSEQPAGRGQELDELVRVQLSGSLGKLAMPDFSFPRDVTVDPDIVGWIDEHYIRDRLLQQYIEGGL